MAAEPGGENELSPTNQCVGRVGVGYVPRL